MSFFNRQAANHPYLVMYSRKELASRNKEAGDVEQSCVLCQDAVEDPVVSFHSSTHSPPPYQEIGKEREERNTKHVTQLKFNF